ncbi:MAG: NADH-ubiquinone oxidoreductase-F iron-sulfur binding region domain-containing protein [Brevinema sp.]
MSTVVQARKTVPHDVALDNPGTILELFKKYVDTCGNEFCGKCMPCRYGTQEWQRLFTKLVEGNGTLDDLAAIRRINLTMRVASLCPMGLNSPYVLDKMLDTYASQLEDFIVNKKPLEKAFTSIPAELLAK